MGESGASEQDEFGIRFELTEQGVVASHERSALGSRANRKTLIGSAGAILAKLSGSKVDPELLLAVKTVHQIFVEQGSLIELGIQNVTLASFADRMRGQFDSGLDTDLINLATDVDVFLQTTGDWQSFTRHVDLTEYQPEGLDGLAGNVVLGLRNGDGVISADVVDVIEAQRANLSRSVISRFVSVTLVSTIGNLFSTVGRNAGELAERNQGVFLSVYSSLAGAMAVVNGGLLSIQARQPLFGTLAENVAVTVSSIGLSSISQTFLLMLFVCVVGIVAEMRRKGVEVTGVKVSETYAANHRVGGGLEVYLPVSPTDVRTVADDVIRMDYTTNNMASKMLDEDCIQPHLKKLKEGQPTQQEKEALWQEKRRCICEKLATIRKQNEGSFPDGSFEFYWKRLGCSSEFAIPLC